MAKTVGRGWHLGTCSGACRTPRPRSSAPDQELAVMRSRH